MKGVSYTVEFLKSGRGKARCAPDPAYPHGKLIDANLDPSIPTCRIELPYPAPECGMFQIDCRLCKSRVLVTAAGRADDPIGVIIPCRLAEVVACRG